MPKKWMVSNLPPKEYRNHFSDYDDIMVQMFYNRGLKAREEIERFFNPSYELIYNPFLLKDMDKAVERILQAIEESERIVVFGDYDVDGITATAVVYKVLEKLIPPGKYGARDNLNFYIPHRIDEGYGLNKKAIDILAEKKTKLIITVDNGISSKEEVLYAKKKGIDIIITDHHEVPKIIPNAVAVINPKRKDCDYPFKDLAGVGVAFKLASALVQYINDIRGREVISEGHLKWYLDLVALGTISDIVPLLDENRIIAHFGLVVLTKTKNVGLKALEKVAGIDFKNSNPYLVGFQVGPRLNAAGRMAHATTALELLLSDDENEAGVLAMKLEKLNRERQETILENIKDLRERISDSELENIIAIKDEKWTSGIIGLIAGRMSEEYSRPVFCMAEEKGLVKGSVRSSIDFNVIETLTVFEKIFINYGGHKGAGGFSLKAEDFEFFYEQVVAYGKTKLKTEDLISSINIEKEIDFSQITKDLYSQIKKFEPFGFKNEEPLFMSRGVRVKEAKKVGKENAHTKLKLVQGSKEFDAILFNHGDLGDQLYYGKDLDVVYKIVENEWMGKKKIELKIEDLKA